VLAQTLSSVSFIKQIVPAKLTLPKIIMHFSTFKYSPDLQKYQQQLQLSTASIWQSTGHTDRDSQMQHWSSIASLVSYSECGSCRAYDEPGAAPGVR